MNLSLRGHSALFLSIFVKVTANGESGRFLDPETSPQTLPTLFLLLCLFLGLLLSDFQSPKALSFLNRSYLGPN